MEKLNLDISGLKKFGITMGIAFAIITLFILVRHRYSIFITSGISVLFFIFVFIMPNFLKPIYVSWMKLAFILGWINTRLILIIIFYLVLTPISIVIELLRIDLLDRRIDKDKNSYWHKKENQQFNILNYEKQF